MKTLPRRPSVLVIDDDRTIRLMTAATLDDAGYDVVEAANAEEGWTHFDRSGADLILLDVILPGMNGFEACALLRAHAEGASVPIVVMTGLDDRRSIVSAYESGATDFITKPIVWDLLPYRVQYALRAHAALQETLRGRALLSRSQALAHMGSWEWNCRTDTLDWSDEMQRIHGTDTLGGVAVAAPAAAGAALLEQVHGDDRASVALALDGAQVRGQAYGIEFRIVRPDGAVRSIFEQTDVELGSDLRVRAVRGIRRDITEQTEANARIRALASFDPLTGLANRALFRDLGKHWLPHAQRQGLRCAVLVIDLDRFKLINETLGPRIGDDVLKAVSERLRECLRSSDPQGANLNGNAEERLGRLGGDEFDVLVVDITEPHQANLVARRILAALAAPFLMAGQELSVSASIGISMTPDDGNDMDALLRNASTAMHAAKLNPQQRICFYDAAMSAEILRKLTLETELKRAIGNGELRVFYQGKVDTRTTRLVGAEALMRWQHPLRGLVSPMEFIPIAEESGLIVALTQWVIGAVCRQLAEWRAAGVEGVAGVPVSINLDGASLQSEGLVERVRTTLADAGLPASAIEFEVTESVLMKDMEQATRTLHQLRAIGVKLSIDDFGTGYSSLAYLKRLPVDVLKIDRSFIKCLSTDASDAAITTAIIAMGHSLNLQLVAEGVETWAQADFLAQHSCFVAQGFLFSKPQPGTDFIELLTRGVPGRPVGV